MNIAIIHHQLQRKGGMETYLCDLIDGFNSEGDNITVYVYKKDKNISTSDSCQVQKYNLQWLPRSYRKFWFSLTVSKKLKQLDYDLTLSLMRSGLQDFVICGGTHRGFLSALNKRARLHDKIEIFFEKRSYQLSSGIIAHSKMMANEISQFYDIDQKKIQVLYPPINTNKFTSTLKPNQAEFKKKYHMHSSKTSILFPSTGHKRKGFFLLFEALKKLPASEFELMMVGDHIQKKYLLPHIKSLGFITDIEEVYAAVDLMILPSFYEPFGLVVAEALQCGTPVIISKNVGASELISENEGIVLKNQSIDDIISAIYEARKKTFTIIPNFAERNGLTIESHIQKIKTFLLAC